jgi:phosphonate transport system substrate-binding protein
MAVCSLEECLRTVIFALHETSKALYLFAALGKNPLLAVEALGSEASVQTGPAGACARWSELGYTTRSFPHGRKVVLRTKSVLYATSSFVFLLTLALLIAGQAKPAPTLAQSAPAQAPTAAPTGTKEGTLTPHTLGAPCPNLPEATAVAPVTATAPAQVSAEKGPIYKFGLTPWQKGQSEDDVRFLFKPMLEWLGTQLHATFLLVSAKDYQQASDFLAHNTVQFANISPVPFVDAQKKTPGIRMLVTELSCNKADNTLSDAYTGYILALKTRTDINSVDDIKGKKFAFVSDESTSGFVVPNALLFKAKGISYKAYFSKTFFPGSHPLVTDAIVAGSVDAGATWDFNWSQAVQKHGDVFKAIWTSPPIPNVGIAVHPFVPAEIQRKVQEVLIHIDHYLLKGLSASAYIAKPDSFYEVIRQLQAAP